MKPQEFILSQLEQLRILEKRIIFSDAHETAAFIYKTLMSKKFRKFSVPEINKTTIESDVRRRVANNEPILIHYPFGGYKLWRLDESPEADWAELFAMIYILRWIKPILDAYSPGVHLMWRFDEVIVEKLNNIPISETEAYRKSFGDILDFLKRFVPSNIEFEIFLERSRYESYAEFEKELAEEVEILQRERQKNGHKLSAAEIAMIDLNVKLKPEQDSDPNWRDENDLVHIAYYNLQSHKKHPKLSYEFEGVVAFPFIFDVPNIIPIGSTKSSVAKFWVGVGALKKRDDSYKEIILSPSQLAAANFTWEDVAVDGLSGKNFQRIRVVD